MNKQDEEQIPVNLWLAGRSYRIRVAPSDEEAIRKAVKIADDKVQELRHHYAGKDDQDFLAMCLLMYATDNAIASSNNPFIQNELKELIKKIDDAL